jgi:hypothetical protein
VPKLGAYTVSFLGSKCISRRNNLKLSEIVSRGVMFLMTKNTAIVMPNDNLKTTQNGAISPTLRSPLPIHQFKSRSPFMTRSLNQDVSRQKERGVPVSKLLKAFEYAEQTTSFPNPCSQPCRTTLQELCIAPEHASNCLRRHRYHCRNVWIRQLSV